MHAQIQKMKLFGTLSSTHTNSHAIYLLNNVLIWYELQAYTVIFDMSTTTTITTTTASDNMLKTLDIASTKMKKHFLQKKPFVLNNNDMVATSENWGNGLIFMFGNRHHRHFDSLLRFCFVMYICFAVLLLSLTHWKFECMIETLDYATLFYGGLVGH